MWRASGRRLSFINQFLAQEAFQVRRLIAHIVQLIASKSSTIRGFLAKEHRTGRKALKFSYFGLVLLRRRFATIQTSYLCSAASSISKIGTSFSTIPASRHSFMISQESAAKLAKAQITCLKLSGYIVFRHSINKGMTPLLTRYLHCSWVPEQRLAMVQQACTFMVSSQFWKASSNILGTKLVSIISWIGGGSNWHSIFRIPSIPDFVISTSLL